MWGQSQYNPASQFIEEIPAELVEWKREGASRQSGGWGSGAPIGSSRYGGSFWGAGTARGAGAGPSAGFNADVPAADRQEQGPAAKGNRRRQRGGQGQPHKLRQRHRPGGGGRRGQDGRQGEVRRRREAAAAPLRATDQAGRLSSWTRCTPRSRWPLRHPACTAPTAPVTPVSPTPGTTGRLSACRRRPQKPRNLAVFLRSIE